MFHDEYLPRVLVSCNLTCMVQAANGRNFYNLRCGKRHSTFSHRTTCCPARHTPADRLDGLV